MQSKKFILLNSLFIVFTLLTYTQTLVGQSGIQVISEEGVSVFLDDTFKCKTTTELGGLIIENVSPGSHQIRLVKTGFNPQIDTISIIDEEVFEYKVRTFIPKTEISEQGNTDEQGINLMVGQVKVQSIPIGITNEIPLLGLKTQKTNDEWKAEKTPVGTYKAFFSGLNKKVDYTISIKENEPIHLFVNLLKGEVEVKGVINAKVSTQSGISNAGSKPVITDKPKEMEFIWVAPGTFKMGSNNGGNDEKPVHSIQISKGFELGKYEVTQAQWQAVMCSNPSEFKGENRPVENVSWNDVQDFIAKLNNMQSDWIYRLPTEAEWEFAALGGNKSKGYKYSGSNDLYRVAWHDGNSGETHEAGTTGPNELGIYDMSGNVWEWCQDWYGEDYYSKSSRFDPQGPSSGSKRVLRGGSWYNGGSYMRVANRDSFNPSRRSSGLSGFRLFRVQN